MTAEKKSQPPSRASLAISRHLKSGGFSMVELLVSTIIATSVIGLASSIVFSNRNLYLKDASRTQVNQNIRAALDIVGSDIRQAGERLTPDFPAVVVNDEIPGTSSDTLILYRSLSDVVFSLCTDITSASSDVDIATVPTDPDTTPAQCQTGAIKDAQVADWEAILNDNGGTIDAYIYDPDNDVGEFFAFSSIDGSNYSISRDSGSWDRNYLTGDAVRIYLLEERRFFLSDLNPNPANCFTPGEFLTLVINNDCANRRFGLTSAMDDFEVRVCDQTDGLCGPSLSFADSAMRATGWTDISSIDISVTSSIDYAAGRDTERTVDSRFFPRNVLSF